MEGYWAGHGFKENTHPSEVTPANIIYLEMHHPAHLMIKSPKKNGCHSKQTLLLSHRYSGQKLNWPKF
ncbi:MAG: hypothetical protein ACJAWO_000321 [Halieaceae bacterium]|jgi:hypothetical protein